MSSLDTNSPPLVVAHETNAVSQVVHALLDKREVALRGSVLRHVSVRDLRAMRIVSQPHRQLPSGLVLGEAQRAFEVHKLAGGRRAKAMHPASPDVQLIAGLPHLAFQPILPVAGLLLR
jgi:hypothetical protein